MVPVSPSPRLRAFRCLNDPQERTSPTLSALDNEDPSSLLGIPFAPFCSNIHDQSHSMEVGLTLAQKNDSHRSKTISTAFLSRHDKKPPRSSQPVPQSQNSNSVFIPIDRPPPIRNLRISTATPPVSPHIGITKLTALPLSPSPSLLSTAPTEDMTERSLTPYSQQSSSSYLQIAANIKPLNSGPHSGSGTSGYSLSPRKSPIKPPYLRNGRGSLCTFIQPRIPCSPGGNSIGSQSTQAEDQTRKQRAKTELCMHFVSGRVCPFGVNCMYAHGEEELQMTKLMDVHRAGLIEDVKTYRTKPCLTWVATGSCPFGRRCAGIHDPRIMGSNSSWLPHTETQGNSISTDINVDGLHQKRLHSILCCNPFGERFSLGLDGFKDLSKMICNEASNKRRRNNLSEINKLSIALQMRGGHDWMYKYRPQHVIFNELCMVMQKRAFRLDKSGRAISMPISGYNEKNNQHILVREIAFGPDSDPTVRGVALWFNIPEKEVSQCTPQQAKRFRWKRTPKVDDQRVVRTRPSAFDSREYFTMIRPLDRDAFVLATDILAHRIKTVEAERLLSLSKRFEALNTLRSERELLEQRFVCLRNHWLVWAWPINTGRQEVDDETPVPPVDGEYHPLSDGGSISNHDPKDGEALPVRGAAIHALWDSFVTNGTGQANTAQTTNYCKSSLTPHRRLRVFEQLGCGETIGASRNLPHILHSHSSNSTASTHISSRQSSRCWKALLLHRDEKHRTANEWEIVRQHFQNARTKRVLTIVQQ